MDVDGIRQALAAVKLPSGEDIVAAGVVAEVELDDNGEAFVVLEFSETVLEVEVADLKAPPAPEAGLSFHGGGESCSADEAVPEGPLAGVRNIIAVASGKGGVGKSTVATNLALALKARGAKVGLCDLDIYGPSVPMQLGVVGARPSVSPDQKKFVPVDAYGLKVMSIGFLVEDDQPVIWRGPIVSSVVKQFLEDVTWGALDYLVIDMPPGTGDAQLTLSQSAPLTGAVIVTTPSELALVDAVKGLQMFRRVDTPVIGLVENMSHYVCTNCGHHSEPFSSGGTARVTDQFGVSLLARIPIEDAIQRGGDTGKPVVAVSPESAQAEAFLSLADQVIEKVPYGEPEKKKKGFLAGIFKK